MVGLPECSDCGHSGPIPYRPRLLQQAGSGRAYRIRKQVRASSSVSMQTRSDAALKRIFTIHEFHNCGQRL